MDPDKSFLAKFCMIHEHVQILIADPDIIFCPRCSLRNPWHKRAQSLPSADNEVVVLDDTPVKETGSQPKSTTADPFSSNAPSSNGTSAIQIIKAEHGQMVVQPIYRGIGQAQLTSAKQTRSETGPHRPSAGASLPFLQSSPAKGNRTQKSKPIKDVQNMPIKVFPYARFVTLHHVDDGGQSYERVKGLNLYNNCQNLFASLCCTITK